MDRSLLVDVVPPAQQPAVNAWAGRMFGFGGACRLSLARSLPVVARTRRRRRS